MLTQFQKTVLGVFATVVLASMIFAPWEIVEDEVEYNPFVKNLEHKAGKTYTKFSVIVSAPKIKEKLHVAPKLRWDSLIFLWFGGGIISGILFVIGRPANMEVSNSALPNPPGGSPVLQTTISGEVAVQHNISKQQPIPPKVQNKVPPNSWLWAFCFWFTILLPAFSTLSVWMMWSSISDMNGIGQQNLTDAEKIDTSLMKSEATIYTIFIPLTILVGIMLWRPNARSLEYMLYFLVGKGITLSFLLALNLFLGSDEIVPALVSWGMGLFWIGSIWLYFHKSSQVKSTYGANL